MKKIAILITGLMRTNSLADGTNTSFETTFKQYFLNNEITDNYEVNIFLVTDKANDVKVYNYFGNYLKGFVMQDYDNHDDILDSSNCVKKYLECYNYRKNNPDKFPIVAHPRSEVMYISYRLYFAYLLMNNYENKHNIKYDYIIRLRTDSSFRQIYNSIKILDDDNNKHILINWDLGFLGRYDIMVHICKLIFKYGEYNYGEIKHDELIVSKLGCAIYLNLSKNWNCWSESPEVQLFEHILNYIYEKNLDSNAIENCSFVDIFSDRHTGVSNDPKVREEIFLALFKHK